MWQPIAAEELAELGQGHPTLRQEVCADKEFQEDYQGADDPNIKMQPTGEGRKPELKTLKKCPSPEKSHVAAKKHVRWADWEEERRQKRILCNRTRSCLHSWTCVALVSIVMSAAAYYCWTQQVEESQIKLRRRADKVLPLQVLKFEFSSDRNGSQLVLGAENRIIFNASGVLAAHDDTVEVMHTAILFRRPGVYLVKMQYEHEFDDVEVHAHLPCDASTRRVVLQGRRDALRKHCFVRNSQNITLAVSTPGKSPKNGGFLSLFLEVAQLG